MIGDSVGRTVTEVQSILAITTAVANVLIADVQIVIPDPDTELSKNDIVCMDFKAMPAQRNARRGSGRGIHGEIGVADDDLRLENDVSSNAKLNFARASCVECRAQTSWPRVIEIVYNHQLTASSAFCVGTVTFGSWECRCPRRYCER